jgi:AhpD family alkylhydroperoxidase
MTVNSTDQPHPAAKNKFQRRYYLSWSSFWSDFKFLVSNRDQIKTAMSSPKLNSAFRERLMLAVTEVNRCRYCRTFHVGQAKQAGIPIEEIATYLKGTIPDEVPEEQKLAVCYARHWAETDSHPDPDYIDQVKGSYGDDGFQAISMVLRMIRMGNLLGNTWDYILFKISLGNWG